jgi:hypothetical protein
MFKMLMFSRHETEEIIITNSAIKLRLPYLSSSDDSNIIIYTTIFKNELRIFFTQYIF